MINSAYESTETSCNHEEGSSASDNVPKEQEKGEGQDSQGLELKRRVGLLSGIALIVGNMIGTGIFISPGGVLERSGSVGLAMIMWTASGLLAVTGSLAYAELGTLIPKSGGEYSYFLDGFGPFHRFWGPLPAFLYSWISVLLLKPATFAIGCLSFANYTILPLLAGLEICISSDIERITLKLTAILCLGLVTALNCFSVDWSLKAQNVFTVAKLAAIALLVCCGVYQLSYGNTKYLARGFEGSSTSIGDLSTAFYGGLWSYDGWNNLNFITEELKNPYVTLPRAIIIGIPLVIICYLCVNVAYLTILSPERIISSAAVAVDAGNLVLGKAGFIIPVAVAMSVLGGILTNTFTAGRLCFATAREGHLIDVLSFVHVESRTPSPALMFTGAIALLLIVIGDVSGLIDLFSFAMWIFYVLAMVVLLILRKTKPDAPRPYRVSLVMPIVTLVVGAGLVVLPVVTTPTLEYLFVVLALLVGVLIYIPFVYYKVSLSCMGSITRTIQLALNVGPTKLSTD